MKARWNSRRVLNARNATIQKLRNWFPLAHSKDETPSGIPFSWLPRFRTGRILSMIALVLAFWYSNRGFASHVYAVASTLVLITLARYIYSFVKRWCRCATCKNNVSIARYDLFTGICDDCRAKSNAAEAHRIAELNAAVALSDAEFNPPPDAQCYLFMHGQQSGPFLPAQIRAMWNAGSITSDAMFHYSKLPDWRPVRSFCDFTCARSSPLSVGAHSLGGERRSWGIALTIFGIVITMYFVGSHDVSVRTDAGSVINLGKQQDRLIGVIIGLAFSVVGVMLTYFPANRGRGHP